MKAKNKLEGATNIRAWKTRIDLVFSRNKALDIVKEKVTEPDDEAGKVKFKGDDIMAMSIIVESVRDHLIPYIADHESSKQMYDALIGLYTINNIGQSMSLMNQLRDVKMTKIDTVASYFMRISQLRDQLKAIDEIVSDKELVTTTLYGLPDSWDSFASSISGIENAPTFERLWTACTQ